jgi:hypothetical protein
MKSDPLATYKRIYKVLSTVEEIFSVSLRMADVLSEMDSKMLLSEFVKMKKTDVSFIVNYLSDISLIERACTATSIMADQIST